MFRFILEITEILPLFQTKIHLKIFLFNKLVSQTAIFNDTIQEYTNLMSEEHL